MRIPDAWQVRCGRDDRLQASTEFLLGCDFLRQRRPGGPRYGEAPGDGKAAREHPWEGDAPRSRVTGVLVESDGCSTALGVP